jgi:alanine racemase
MPAQKKGPTGFRPTRVEVNLDNLSHNICEVKKLLKSGTLFMAIVKADAYGHGAVESSKLFLQNGADWLGVATLSEAQELRNAGIKAPTLILGYTPDEQFTELLDTDIRPTIYDVDQAKALNKIVKQGSKKIPIHIKIDTGLSRLGFLPNDESIKKIVSISQLEGLKLEGIFTHFASSGAEDKSYTKMQFQRFMWVIEKLEGEGIKIPLKHVSNSSAIVEIPEYNLSMVRGGTILYGLDPYENSKKEKIFLPAFTLKSRLSHVKTVQAGTGIGYGSTYTTAKRSKIGTLPIGYVDGYRSSLAKKGSVEVRGHRAPIVGVIAMDQLMIDLTGIEGVKIGDEVTLIGYAKEGVPSVNEVAEWGDTFSHELLCAISRRVPRVYISRGKIIKVVDYLLQC